MRIILLSRVSAHVLSQRSRMGKYSSTLVTFKSFLSTVCDHVTFQPIGLCKPFPALGTFMRFLSGVREHVRLQRRVERKRCPALGTFMRPLSVRVHEHVGFKAREIRKGLSALVATMRPLSSVYKHMHFEVGTQFPTVRAFTSHFRPCGCGGGCAVRSGVIFKSRQVPKPLSAVLAFVWLLSRMYAHVESEGSTEPAFLTADTANVRFHLRVDQHVVLQMGPMSKAPSALDTFVRFLSGVRKRVNFKSA